MLFVILNTQTENGEIKRADQKAYQPDNTAVTEERLSNLRSYQPSRGMESQGRPGTDQGERPGTEATGRTTEPQKDLAEERLASLRSHKPRSKV